MLTNTLNTLKVQRNTLKVQNTEVVTSGRKVLELVIENAARMLSTYGGRSLQMEAEQFLRYIRSGEEDEQGAGLNIHMAGAVTGSDSRSWATRKIGVRKY